MASLLYFLVLSLSCSFLFSPSESNNVMNPAYMLVLPTQKDASTGLHWTNLLKRTPLTQVPVLVDLNGNQVWLNCEQHYSSKTYEAPFCHSAQCFRANTHQCLSCPAATRPGCHKNTCGLMSTNPVTQQNGLGELGQDVLGIHISLGTQLGEVFTVPQFLFSCAPSFLLQKGLPKNIEGVAGLGHAPISLANQLDSHFGLQRQFTTCLSRYSSSSKGAIIFGDAPNNLHEFHGHAIFHDLAYTPLTITPQGEYNVRVNSMRINQYSVAPVKKISSTTVGHSGGTMISTSTPHMVLQQSLYESFVQVFAQQLPKQSQVKALAPFELCFRTKNISEYPSVELVMEKPNGPVWRISGEDLTVQTQPGVSCLAVVNGGMQPRAEITIGARQLEENLVVFDLAKSRVGFSTSPLSSFGVKCGDLFNFVNV
ncbi:basic 7S globulin 2-like [Vigna unguiculata]|uniref:basic 7S globulin 2-like n=1 Tax=Vigna unguiculata TaxID=3917 RepID=UPI001015D3A7|nr:basic 7S globulin 2-like [Vigna unguiculata]